MRARYLALVAVAVLTSSSTAFAATFDLTFTGSFDVHMFHWDDRNIYDFPAIPFTTTVSVNLDGPGLADDINEPRSVDFYLGRWNR